MSADSEPEAPQTVRRELSYLRRAEPTHEFSIGKLAILAAVLVAAITATVMLMVLR